jgi:hypothetical protein
MFYFVVKSPLLSVNNMFFKRRMIMLNEKRNAIINTRLNGTADKFIRDSQLYGLNYTRNLYRLEDIDFNYLHDWIQEKSGTPIRADRGIIQDPREHGEQNAEYLLDAFLKKLATRDKKIAELEEIIRSLTNIIEYRKHHPMEAINDKTQRILEE